MARPKSNETAGHDGFDGRYPEKGILLTRGKRVVVVNCSQEKISMADFSLFLGFHV